MENYPNRCQHLKINGTQCGSPALRRNRFCFFHKRFQDERIHLATDRKRRAAATFILPVLEDANSIQVALMQVMRLLVSQQIESKVASLLLYALQTASANLRMTEFKPRHHDVILDPRAAADSLLDKHLWSDRDFEEEEEEEEDQNDPLAELREKQRLRELERVRHDINTIEYFKNWSKTHSGWHLIRQDGKLVILPIEPEEAAAHMQKMLPNPSAAPQATTAPQPAAKPQAPPAPPVSSAPVRKKPASSMTTAEIREELSDMIRKSGLPEMHAARLAGEREKKAT
jgi:hypothetical protein